MSKIRILFFLILVVNTACNDRDDYNSIKGTQRGFIPIYMDSATFVSKVVSIGAKPIVNAGKIYLYKHFLFINELNEGVHVFDNTNPNAPLPICFIVINGNTDISAKDDILYVQTAFGLLFFNISNLPIISDITILDSPNQSLNIAPLPNDNGLGFGRFSRSKIFFECVDLSRGKVVGWKEADLVNPKCYK